MGRHWRRKIFIQIIKNSVLGNLITGYLIYFAIISLLFVITEPGINTYGDGLWYAFVSSTTIGFGDFTAVSMTGRVLTVILYWYTIIVIALITAVFTQFFIEMTKAKRDRSVAMLQAELEELDTLPKERLSELSKVIKNSKEY